MYSIVRKASLKATHSHSFFGSRFFTGWSYWYEPPQGLTPRYFTQQLRPWIANCNRYLCRTLTGSTISLSGVQPALAVSSPSTSLNSTHQISSRSHSAVAARVDSTNWKQHSKTGVLRGMTSRSSSATQPSLKVSTPSPKTRMSFVRRSARTRSMGSHSSKHASPPERTTVI